MYTTRYHEIPELAGSENQEHRGLVSPLNPFLSYRRRFLRHGVREQNGVPSVFRRWVAREVTTRLVTLSPTHLLFFPPLAQPHPSREVPGISFPFLFLNFKNISRIYFLFIFGCAWSSLLFGLFCSCGARTSHCGGFSCCKEWALGTRALIIAAHGPVVEGPRL